MHSPHWIRDINMSRCQTLITVLLFAGLIARLEVTRSLPLEKNSRLLLLF